MASQKSKNNSVEHNSEHEYKAFNPTKSKVGRVIIVVLALGMFLGMLITAIINMINVLNG